MADSEEPDIVLSEWMSRLPESLWNIPLNQLAIPGLSFTLICIAKLSVHCPCKNEIKIRLCDRRRRRE